MKNHESSLTYETITMENYIDGFVLPIPRKYMDDYKKAVEQVAEIWLEYGATAYFEFTGDDMRFQGVRSFIDAVEAKDDEEIVFGWVVFPSKAIRDHANSKVPNDPRMAEIVTPLIHSEKLIFDAGRMVYGGFKPLVQLKD